jgi:hypothetical protein
MRCDVGISADRQLDLFGARLWERERRVAVAGALADGLSSLVGQRVRLVVHDNRSTMVSFRRLSGVLHYRVHHMFLEAPPEVVQALAVFAGAGREAAARRRAAGVRIDDYVRLHRVRIGEARPALVRPRGAVHDLQAILDRLNAEQFGGQVRARIGWGPRRGGGRRRTIKTGVYVQDAALIRIHPALDHPEVPEAYVAAVVFHEMLHEVVPAVVRNGRRVVHGPEFRRRERAYPLHEWARRWEQANLHLLLSPR